MKIAITGASGFIGQALLEVLLNRNDADIIALTRGSAVQESAASCVWINTDYSENSLVNALQKVDAVIHLAGKRGTTPNPEEYIINETVTENVLKAMAITGTKHIVFASTISVYDDVDLIPWSEDDLLKGRTAYGESKIRCERLIKKYASEYNYTYAVARIAQVIGEGEKRRGMMNVFVDTAHEGGILKIMGKSVAKRQYILVDDLAEILTMLTFGNNRYNPGTNIVVNVGMVNAYTNLEIAQTINSVFDNSTPINYDQSEEETIRGAHMDVGRLTGMIGYKPKDLRESIICIKNARD